MTFFLLNSIAFLFSLIGFTGIRIIAYLLGFIAFDILRIRRKIILGNLNIVYGSSLSAKEKRKIGRKSIINFISTALEFLASKRLSKKIRFELENKEVVDHIWARKEGLYVICFHFGNWEYLCHINSKLFAPVNVVVKDVLKGKAEEWIKNLRKYLGYKLTDRNGPVSSSSQIFKAIDNKEIVGFIVDQKRAHGLKLPFFNHPAPTNDSLAKLYFRKKAPITSVIITRIKPGYFKLKYCDEFIYKKDPSLSLSENIAQFTLQINRFLEPIILAKPDEYYWLHNRWNLKK